MIVIRLNTFAGMAEIVSKLTGDVMILYDQGDQIPVELHVAMSASKAKFSFEHLAPSPVPGFSLGMVVGKLQASGTPAVVITDSEELLSVEPVPAGKGVIRFDRPENALKAVSEKKDSVRKPLRRKKESPAEKPLKAPEEILPAPEDTELTLDIVPDTKSPAEPAKATDTDGNGENEKKFRKLFSKYCPVHKDEWVKAFYVMEITADPADLKANLSMVLGGTDAIDAVCGVLTEHFSAFKALVQTA